MLLTLLFSQGVIAQTKQNCAHCNMIIKDELHKAKAVNEGELLDFDAIECMINYLKVKPSLSEMRVVDYNSGNFIEANTAYYLKSKGIPSPMGAHLTAFEQKEVAEKTKAKKGGEVYTWDELKKRFEDSDFGDINSGHHHHNRPDSHAPIGVMGDHLHHKGGLMFSFRYMGMSMNGNRNSTGNVDDQKIYDDYMVAPQAMNMHMYMMGAMYAPTDNITIMAMQNIVNNRMDLTARMMMGTSMGGMMNGMMESRMMTNNFSTSSNGFGDLKLSGLCGLIQSNGSSLHLNSRISIPIGSLKEKDDTPMNEDVKLPYRMQLGTGTFDYSIGATYKKMMDQFSFGCQLLGTLRTGKNSENYRWGNKARADIWAAYLLHKNISVSSRIQAISEGKIQGEDSDYNAMMAPPFNNNNYGGEFLRSFFGVNIAFNDNGYFKRLSLGAEAGIPLIQNVNGYQMNEEYSLTLGLKYSLL